MTQNANISISFFFCDFVQKQTFAFFAFFAFSVFCHNFCTNYDLDLLSTSKWPSESQFSLVGKIWPGMVNTWPFISWYFLGVCQTRTCRLHLRPQFLNKSRFWPVQHLKMIVWTSVFWKINIHYGKKWPERVLQQSFISIFHCRSEYILSWMFQYMYTIKSLVLTRLV